MNPERAAAAKLLELMEKWVDQCDLWDRHHSTAANNGYGSLKAESEMHQILQKEHTLPLMQECVDNKFTYVDLMQMIPPAFRTNSATRRKMLAGFKKWARKEYEI